MTRSDITITDTHNNNIVETVRDARIPDRMRIKRNYCGLEHDGRFAISETRTYFDALGIVKKTVSI